ncbi:hypothetical protein AB0M02_22575 [Actinoplanes sp. NPDC051861]|uniref:hypothetical protein n=1 Tax=Actinoplanes sp. NPDC051861 TaxID=3155170 RepID=UPI0034264071
MGGQDPDGIADRENDDVNWLEFSLLHATEPCAVQVETGNGPVQVGPCLVTDRTVFCPPDTVAPPGSRITLPTGDTVRVVDAHYLDSCGTRLPEHWQLEVAGRR